MLAAAGSFDRMTLAFMHCKDLDWVEENLQGSMPSPDTESAAEPVHRITHTHPERKDAVGAHVVAVFFSLRLYDTKSAVLIGPQQMKTSTREKWTDFALSPTWLTCPSFQIPFSHALPLRYLKSGYAF